MLFGSVSRLSDFDSFSITTNGSQIKHVSQIKYLGVVFDKRLSWNDHIKYLLTKARKRVGILGHIRYNITYSSALIPFTVYFSDMSSYRVLRHCLGVLR